MKEVTVTLSSELQTLSDEHREWLSDFDPRYLRNWKTLLNNDSESALAEASVRQRLQNLGAVVEPNEDLDSSQQAPDFKCMSQGICFYVEVACIRIETAEKATGIPHNEAYEGSYGTINLSVFNKCIDKVRQASVADAPLLVAVGTWHGDAAMQFDERSIVNMLLTGETKLSWSMNMRSGESTETYLTTNMYPALFLKPDGDKNPSPAREPISGAMLCAFGIPRIDPVVILNPHAKRPFDPAALSQLEYGAVGVDCDQQRLSVEWTKGSEQAAGLIDI